MSSRALSFCVVLLICMLGVLAWRHFVVDRQIVAAAFVDAQCELTRRMVDDVGSDPRALALRLGFLVGYYDHWRPTLASSPILPIVERGYTQTVTNVLAALRAKTSEDLGADPRVWIKRYSQ